MRGSKGASLVLAALILISAVTVTVATNKKESKPVTASPEVYDPETYVYATIGQPQYLDPATDYETSGGEVIQNVYETLIWWDRESAASLKPVLATQVPSISNGGISLDGLNYTFNLRPSVKFHDGSVMTADDVEYSFERVLRIHDPDGPSWMLEQVMNDYIQYYVGDTLGNFKMDSYQPSWLLAAIGGTSDNYRITELDVQNVSQASVVKLDSDTVRLRLTHPYSGFLQICSYTVCSIVSKTFVEAHGGTTNAQHNEYMDQNTCGTGPYKLVTWDVGTAINMTRFDEYWGPKPAIRDVSIQTFNDVNTRILMLQNGEADSAYIPIDFESIFSGDEHFEITKGLTTFIINLVGFNLNINATAAAGYGSNVPSDFFAQKNVRKAFTHLMDAPTFIQSYMKGNGIQPNGIIPAGMFGYNASAPVYDYNITKAMELLQNTTSSTPGQSWWDAGFTVAFIFNAGNVLREIASQYLKQALESLNALPGTHGTFHATINSLDWPTYLTQTQLKPSPLPVFFLGWAPDYADPDDYVNPFLYSHGTYPTRTGYSNASIDENLTLAASELNSVVRKNYYDNVTNLCYDDAPYVWLVQENNFHVERSWVQGYYFNPMYGGQYYAALSKQPLNSAPVFNVWLPLNSYANTGEEKSFTIRVFDADFDIVNVTWDWGDGTQSTNVTTGLSVGEWLTQNHTWTIPPVPGLGDYEVIYNMTVTLDDGHGNNTTRSCIVHVYVPINISPTIGMMLSKSLVDLDESFTIIANASDPEGEPLTWTYTVSNQTSSEIIEVRTTNWTAPSALVWNNLTTSLSIEDNYTITLNVSDSIPPYQVGLHNLSLCMSLTVTPNHQPDVTAMISTLPASPVIDVAVGEIEVSFLVEAFDRDGDSVTATWYLGDDFGPLTNTSAGGPMIYTFIQTRTFNQTGVYNISVLLTDGRTGHEVLRERQLTITSNDLPPQLLDVDIAYSQVVSALPNETIFITLTFTDPEEDVLEVVVDFGDGSAPSQFNVTSYSGGVATLVVNHSYELVGVYNMTVSYTDNMMGISNHSLESMTPVVVSATLIPEFTTVILPLLGIIVFMMLARFRRSGASS